MKTRQKVPYAKEKRERILRGPGATNRQGVQSAPKSKVLEPKFDTNELKKIVEDGLTNVIATEGVLSISEETITSIVREAVDYESKRYQSGVNSLNDQLNAAKIKIDLMNKENDKLVHHKEHIEALEDKIRLKDRELKRRNIRVEELEDGVNSFNETEADENAQILNRTIKELNKELGLKNKKIDSLKIKLEDRSVRLMEASKQTDAINILKETLNEMKVQISNVAGGELTIIKPQVSEDRVFIDPSENKDHLKSHIDVEASSILSSKGDFDKNKDKLRELLKKGDYTPTKAKLKQ